MCAVDLVPAVNGACRDGASVGGAASCRLLVAAFVLHLGPGRLGSVGGVQGGERCFWEQLTKHSVLLVGSTLSTWSTDLFMRYLPLHYFKLTAFSKFVPFY